MKQLRRRRHKDEKDPQKSEAELRRQYHQMLGAREEERQAIARELHDQMGQSLTVLALILNKIKGYVPEAGVEDLDEAMEMVMELGDKMRHLSHSLYPGMLETMGLLPVLLSYFNEFKKRTGIEVDFQHSGLENHLPNEVNINVYRIIEEALNNVAKHAGVKKASVIGLNGDSVLAVQIQDSGRGFNPEKIAAPIGGLGEIRERACSLGGALRVESAPGAGTMIRVEVPTRGLSQPEGGVGPHAQQVK